MVDCLRRERLYSEKRPRDILFRVIDQIVSGRRGAGMILSRLNREAAGRARQKAESAGFEFGNWDTTSKAVVKAMLNAGVLMTLEGHPVAADITAQATPVAALRDEYLDITEALLLEFLIRRLGDITTRDHTALAHAMFRQFDPNVPIEDLTDRVVILLTRLSDRVELNGDAYSVRSSRNG